MIYQEPIDLEWLEEEVESLKNESMQYRFACFFLRKKKLTYKDVYLITIGMTQKKHGADKAREKALQAILKIYKQNHDGKLPKGFNEKKKEEHE